MITNRTPLHRQFRTQITKRSLAIFVRMLEIERGCVEYRALDWELHAELKLKIWEGSALWHPHWEPSHPASTAGGEWQRHGGPELFRLLEDAACAVEFS